MTRRGISQFTGSTSLLRNAFELTIDSSGLAQDYILDLPTNIHASSRAQGISFSGTGVGDWTPFGELTVFSQATDKTLTIEDGYSIQYFTGTGDYTATIPANATVNYKAGTPIHFIHQATQGSLRISATGTIISNFTIANQVRYNHLITAYNLGADVWFITDHCCRTQTQLLDNTNAAVSWDYNNGTNAGITASTDHVITLNNASAADGVGLFRFTQDATGGRTFTAPGATIQGTPLQSPGRTSYYDVKIDDLGNVRFELTTEVNCPDPVFTDTGQIDNQTVAQIDISWGYMILVSSDTLFRIDAVLFRASDNTQLATQTIAAPPAPGVSARVSFTGVDAMNGTTPNNFYVTLEAIC